MLSQNLNISGKLYTAFNLYRQTLKTARNYFLSVAINVHDPDNSLVFGLPMIFLIFH